MTLLRRRCCAALSWLPILHHPPCMLYLAHVHAPLRSKCWVLETRVGKLLSTLLDLVQAWLWPAAINPWSLMTCWSTDFINDESILQVARRMCLSIIAGSNWRFDKFYSDFLYRLHKLLDTGADAEELTESIVGRWGVGVFDFEFRCCLDWCTRQLLSPLAPKTTWWGHLAKACCARCSSRSVGALPRWNACMRNTGTGRNIRAAATEASCTYRAAINV